MSNILFKYMDALHGMPTAEQNETEKDEMPCNGRRNGSSSQGLSPCKLSQGGTHVSATLEFPRESENDAPHFNAAPHSTLFHSTLASVGNQARTTGEHSMIEQLVVRETCVCRDIPL